MVAGCLLAIDTSSTQSGVALVDAQGTKARSFPGAESSERIVSVLRELSGDVLSRCGISAVAVALGPGSYTGLRIGIASALGIGEGLGIPVYGVSVLFARSFYFVRQLGQSHSVELSSSIYASPSERFSARYSFVPAADRGPADLIQTDGGALSCTVLSELGVTSVGSGIGQAELDADLSRGMALDCDIIPGQLSNGVSVQWWLAGAPLGVEYAPGAIAVATTVRSLLSYNLVGDGLLYGGNVLSELEPLYVKAVNAKTLAERGKAVALLPPR